MIGFLRLAISAGAIALAGYALELAHPGWVPELATDVWTLPNLRSDLHEELEFGSQLEVEMSAVLSRVHAKQQALRDLIDERLTLIEVAARYRELDRKISNDEPVRLRAAWPGHCVLERYCNQIIQATEWEFSQKPCTAAAVVARLRSEFKEAEESGAFCSAE